MLKMPQLGLKLNSSSYQHARLNDQTLFSCLSQPTNKFVVQHCSAFGCLRYKGQNVKVLGCCSGSIAALSQVFLRIGPPLHSGPKDKIVVGLLPTWESSGTLETVGHTRLLRLGVANSVQNTLPQLCVWGISYKHWTFTSLRSLQWFWPTSASRMQFWPCMSKLQYVAQERTWPTWQLGPVWWWEDAFRSTGSCASMWRHKHRSANENTFFVLTQKDCWNVHMICTLLITWTLVFLSLSPPMPCVSSMSLVWNECCFLRGCLSVVLAPKHSMGLGPEHSMERWGSYCKCGKCFTWYEPSWLPKPWCSWASDHQSHGSFHVCNLKWLMSLDIVAQSTSSSTTLNASMGVLLQFWGLCFTWSEPSWLPNPWWFSACDQVSHVFLPCINLKWLVFLQQECLNVLPTPKPSMEAWVGPIGILGSGLQIIYLCCCSCKRY